MYSLTLKTMLFLYPDSTV